MAEMVGQMSKAMIELMEEVAVDVFLYEEKQKVKISNKDKAFLIAELVNSCINRGVSYRDNPLRNVLFSLLWKEKATGDNAAPEGGES